MAFCSQCGFQLPDDARFCPECGTAASNAAPIAAAADVSPVSAVDRSAADRAANPGHPDHYRRPGAAAAVPSSNAAAWILPVLVVLALLAIAYVLATRGDDGDGEQAVATSERSPPAARGEDVGSTRRAVDDAADTATDAAGRARGSASYVSAATLDSAFRYDPVGAAARYAGPVTVTGTIASMVQPGPTPALAMEGRSRLNTMVVNFPEGYRTRLAPLAKGQVITVGCAGARTFGGTTILSDCLLR